MPSVERKGIKRFGFIELNDGSFKYSDSYEDNLDNFKEVSKFNVGSAIRVEGKLVLTQTSSF